ncbi:patatin-like phospholipase family protein [Alphaproteobacteria bacterium KMM 3653]|uniref:Patatin-like phospholipase family protein n=1 Tax=Harenicola maris TaxID=2841044 RepID=A0AAP2G392_9RHOB|nr:patatin-like phospholipase family protein [Harenicola maris]
MAGKLKRRINLALQGGGAHGAFTWGVLDRLLQEPDLEIAAISGTSAGAMNGAAVKSGMIKGGREGARDNLQWLWEQMGAAAAGSAAMNEWAHPSAAVMSRMIEYSAPFQLADAATRMLSPYSYGPLYSNPLEQVVEKFDYDKVCAHEDPRLFVCATNVRSGRVRVFRDEEINSKVLLASACLPTVFQAVELHDESTGQLEAFWDGGYMGNPALFPLFPSDLPADIVIVNINPLYRDEVPKTPQSIANRINEISFNSSLLRELRAIHFVQRLLTEGQIEPGKMKNVLIHMISDDKMMRELSVATKTFPNPVVLAELKAAGIAAAENFLNTDAAHIGKQNSADLPAMFGDGTPGY